MARRPAQVREPRGGPPHTTQRVPGLHGAAKGKTHGCSRLGRSRCARCVRLPCAHSATQCKMYGASCHTSVQHAILVLQDSNKLRTAWCSENFVNIR